LANLVASFAHQVLECEEAKSVLSAKLVSIVIIDSNVCHVLRVPTQLLDHHDALLVHLIHIPYQELPSVFLVLLVMDSIHIVIA
jgi:hypothetical protein